MPAPGLPEILLLSLVALVAGTIDAIAGGGGLLTVPALLAAGLPPHLVLGTNKGQSVFGSFAALVRFARGGLVDARRARVTFPLGLAGSIAGAALALALPASALRPALLMGRLYEDVLARIAQDPGRVWEERVQVGAARRLARVALAALPRLGPRWSWAAATRASRPPGPWPRRAWP